MCRLVLPSLVVAGVLAASLSPGAAQAPPRPPTGPTQSSGERVLSPAVVGGWFTHSDAPGSDTLDLLVLWRGSPGWFLRGGPQGGSSGGSGTGRRHLTLKYGGLFLQVLFDGPARLAEIEDRKIPLNDDNVLLVDDVDSAGGPKVVKTLRVDPDLSDPHRAEIAIRRSPELVAYLRCDIKLSDARQQATMDIICAQVIGK
jgi:hypothetical protein